MYEAESRTQPSKHTDSLSFSGETTVRQSTAPGCEHVFRCGRAEHKAANSPLEIREKRASARIGVMFQTGGASWHRRRGVEGKNWGRRANFLLWSRDRPGERRETKRGVLWKLSEPKRRRYVMGKSFQVSVYAQEKLLEFFSFSNFQGDSPLQRTMILAWGGLVSHFVVFVQS